MLQGIGFGGTVMIAAQDFIICEVKDDSTAECIDRQSISRFVVQRSTVSPLSTRCRKVDPAGPNSTIGRSRLYPIGQQQWKILNISKHSLGSQG